jgi:hypothetical protein
MKCKGRKSRYGLVACCLGKDSNTWKDYGVFIVVLIRVMPKR